MVRKFPDFVVGLIRVSLSPQIKSAILNSYIFGMNVIGILFLNVPF
jgi:hypothetical protein